MTLFCGHTHPGLITSVSKYFFPFSNLVTCLSALPQSHIVSQHCFMRQFNSMRHIIRQLGDKFQHSLWLDSFEELDVLVIMMKGELMETVFNISVMVHLQHMHVPPNWHGQKCPHILTLCLQSMKIRLIVAFRVVRGVCPVRGSWPGQGAFLSPTQWLQWSPLLWPRLGLSIIARQLMYWFNQIVSLPEGLRILNLL